MAEPLENVNPPFSPGPLAFGKYQLFAKLGSGGMAEVYLALLRGPMQFSKLVVLKRMRAPMADHAPMVTMFLDEARLAARLTHPNIVHTYEVGEHEGAYFIAMEYLEGQSLNKVRRAPQCREMITPVMWARVVADALRGLHHAHTLADYDGRPLGIVHRDISPHNIFLTYSGEAKVVDFGIAKAAVNATHTETGVLKGKISYMSPEQMRGEVDCRSDLFAMGVTLWELLVGKKLFLGDSVHVLNAVLNEPIPRARSVRAEIAPALDDIVAKALEKDVDNRYQTADEMREALEAYVRSTGEVIREATIGRAVTLMFHELKDKVDRQVQTHMQGTPPSVGDIATLSLSGSLPTLPEIGEQPTPANLELKLPLIMTQSGVPSGTPPPPDPTSGFPGKPSTPAEPPRKRGWIPAVGGALLVFLVLGIAGVRVITTKTPDAAAAAHLAPTKTIAVSLESSPSEASVVWNGLAIGRTPVRVEVPPGMQSFAVSKDGYDGETIALDISGSGGPLSRSVTLRAREKEREALAIAIPSNEDPKAEPKAPAMVRGGKAGVRPIRTSAALGAGAPATPAVATTHPATPAPAATPTIKVKILEDDDPKKRINVIPE